eukprot:TRINITY_DN318_c0_g1_i1.p1 TRINITY_DN318_c0_g1~~TRINITY_DN318_c0_g1_i1.p1  ORF type:complete len:563 (+),score=110.18 TRINITY_DN318_c0_g1_i1:129-1817(+)
MASSPSASIQSAMIAFILALLAFGGLFVAFGGLGSNGFDRHMYEGTPPSLSEEAIESAVQRVLDRHEARRVIVQAEGNASLNLDALSQQILDRLKQHLHGQITDYIDQVAQRVGGGNGTAIVPSRPTLAPQPPLVAEVRWTGGSRSQRCLDVNEHWQGQARAWNCQGKSSNWQKLVLTKEGRLEFQNRCVDATGASSGQPVSVKPCSSSAPGQQWEYNPSPDANLRPTASLINKATKLCLAVKDGGYPETIIMKTCDSSCTLTWSVTLDERSAQQKAAVVTSYNERIRNTAPRIVCWIMTHYGNRQKAIAVNNTWGRRCTHLMFMSSTPDPALPIVLMDIGGKQDSRSMLRTKSKQGWLHVYNNYLDKGDFFLKGDDDSYVVMENLKAFLQTKDPNAPEHYGRLFHYGGRDKPLYYSGGSTIILTHEAMKRLGEGTKSRGDAIWPKPDTGQAEDLRISQVLDFVGVKTADTRTKDGKHQFLALGVNNERNLKEPADRSTAKLWFWKYSKDAVAGPGCCSNKWVASHYTKDYEMYAMDAMERSQCTHDGTSWPWLLLPSNQTL